MVIERPAISDVLSDAVYNLDLYMRDDHMQRLYGSELWSRLIELRAEMNAVRELLDEYRRVW
jgi:hypothetical protein